MNLHDRGGLRIGWRPTDGQLGSRPADALLIEGVVESCEYTGDGQHVRCTGPNGGFREVGVVGVREVLRGWPEGAGLRKVGERAGVDRKTARRYVQAAEAEGLTRAAGVEALTDSLVGAVVAAVRPARPNGHGAAWEALLGHEEQIKPGSRAATGRGR